MGNIGGPSLIDDGILCVAYVIGQVTMPVRCGRFRVWPPSAYFVGKTTSG